MKEKFFEKFYNHLAQAVYHCLKTAFPKNRNTLETPETKRKLLNTFSELFTGMQIHSAKFSQWLDNSKGNSGGAENGGKGGRGKNSDNQQEGKNMSLAEL